MQTMISREATWNTVAALSLLGRNGVRLYVTDIEYNVSLFTCIYSCNKAEKDEVRAP
jgi:hypothetical protein